MAVDKFIPEIVAANVMVALNTALTYGSPGCINQDYEGEISEYGGSVVINTATDPTIETYTPYTAMTGGTAATTGQTMSIDQAKAWSVDLDDVNAAQARDSGELMSKISQRAAHLLAKTADAYVGGLMAAGVDADNLTAEATVAPSAVYDLLVDLRTTLSENDVPVDGRWVVVTPAIHGALLKDQRFISSGDTQGAATRSSGVVGRAAGFTVLESNQVPDGPGSGAGKLVIAGHAIATTYAQQVSKVEAVRLTDKFVDRTRGLHLYGAKVIRPTCLAAADVILGTS
jgi:N4-gp56 family major capsid protein